MTNHVETLQNLLLFADDPIDKRALEAAIAALDAQQSEAVAKAWLIYADNGMLIKAVTSEQERDSLLFTNGGKFPTWTAEPLYTSPTPAMRAVVEALRDVRRWAASKCPCKDETPDPCTLCGATVASGACRSVESIFPAALLAQLDAALAEAAKMLETTNG